MINCAWCGKPIENNESTLVDKHISVATKDFKFHPTMECAGEFERRQAIGLGLYKEPEQEENN